MHSEVVYSAIKDDLIYMKFTELLTGPFQENY
jgi:hypothetical protein